MESTKKRARPVAISWVRLEKGQGAERIVWEISRKKATVTISQGPYGRAGRTTVKEHHDEARAQAAYERAIETKRADAFVEAAQAVVGGSSKKGVSVRNPELEALIEEDVSDLSRYLVYGDWLQQQGDPRGELVVTQHGLSSATDDDELEALEGAEARLFKMFGTELLGGISRYSRVKDNYADVRGLAWRCGFLRAARLPSSGAATRAEQVIGHASARFLEHLAVPAEALGEVCAVLQEKRPRTLTSLALTGSYHEASLEPLTRMPGIRRLVIGCALRDSGRSVIPSVEDLFVALGSPPTLAVLGKTTWPSLKRAHITFSVIDDVDVSSTLAEIVRQMPSVEHLSLRRWMTGYDDDQELAPRDSLALGILETLSVVPNGLRRLDLEIALSSAGAEALVELLRLLQPWLRVHLPKRAIADATLRSKYARDLGVVFDDDEPDRRDPESIDAYHHARLQEQ